MDEEKSSETSLEQKGVCFNYLMVLWFGAFIFFMLLSS